LQKTVTKAVLCCIGREKPFWVYEQRKLFAAWAEKALWTHYEHMSRKSSFLQVARDTMPDILVLELEQVLINVKAAEIAPLVWAEESQIVRWPEKALIGIWSAKNTFFFLV
jgi:hypothetical protein